MSQFNGYFGCSVVRCASYEEHTTPVFIECYIPWMILLRSGLKKLIVHIFTTVNKMIPLLMVWKAPISALMPVPIVPLDSRHLLHLGIVKSIVQHILKQRLVNVGNVDDILKSASVPVAMRRKPRSLLFKIKASEWKQLILHFLCVLWHWIWLSQISYELPSYNNTPFEWNESVWKWL